MPSSYSAGKFARAGGGDAVLLQGFDSLQRALGRVEGGVQDELRQKIRAIGEKVALVAASNAPRRTGELQTSIRVSVASRAASVYSTAIYGGAQNVGAWTGHGRGPHIRRARASHYMDRAVKELAPWVETEMAAVLGWLETTFEA